MPRDLLRVVLSERLQGYIVMLPRGIRVIVKYKCKCVFAMKYKHIKSYIINIKKPGARRESCFLKIYNVGNKPVSY